MPEQTTSSIVIDAPRDVIMEVIGDFPAYPTWAKGVQVADVLAESEGWADRVHFVLDVPPIKDEYTLEYEWDGYDSVRWWLVEGKLLKELDGVYTLRDLGEERTEVTYALQLDLHIPLIGLIKRKGERTLIDTALRGLKKHVESL